MEKEAYAAVRNFFRRDSEKGFSYFDFCYRDLIYSIIKFFDPVRTKICHSCESRNPFLTDAALPGAVDSCFRRNDKKNLIIEI
ncbi:Uncharacterized protein dnm_088710 [Desulfonema magnum]|uniref:Uncharacterized protein n=1 Tax=Desulfonema magnum TaxID=45655 RepID=A0A975BW04_9BACT|nr:Uncharacterized protein dnm_088710 [Desulfonema magnum]